MATKTSNNGQTHKETRLRLAESRNLQRVTALLLKKRTAEEVLEIVRQEARTLTNAAGGSVFLLEEDAWLRETNGDIELNPLAERIPVIGTLTGQAVLSGKPVLINDYTANTIEVRTPSSRTDSLLVVPLQVEGVAIGAINVANKAGGFTENDARILGYLADVAAIAIENARLREKAERLAIVEERQWLARELHDSVTQAMYSVTLYAEAARMALAAGKLEVVSENLIELQAMAREALFDIRLLIFELQPPILEGKGLAASLRIRLAAVESRAGLITDIQVEGGQPLSLPVEEDLYRIALEALNNVVKHARAQHVKVYIGFDNHRIYLKITDDGQGYEPVIARESGGMGIRSMEERAERLKGKLEIRSVPGQGTSVNVEVPL
jgi:signal transduction histidine kinase